MHDNHEPSCVLCTKFVLPFGEDSPLADWGYCARELRGAPPSATEIAEIEKRAKEGDHGFLRGERVLLYEGFGEGCDSFEDAGHHHH